MNNFLFSFPVDMAHTVSIFQQKTLDRAGAAGDVGQRHLPKEACLNQNNKLVMLPNHYKHLH